MQSYLNDYFKAPAKIQEAEREIRMAEDKMEQPVSDSLEAKVEVEAGVEAARIWLSRVKQWAAHMLRDLQDDAVLSPAGDRSLWLLYGPACFPDDLSGSLHCKLCSVCATAFRKHKKRCALP